MIDVIEMSPNEFLIQHADVIQKGALILTHPCSSVALTRDGTLIKHLHHRLLNTMQYLLHQHSFSKGLGLSAPQIGYSLRIFSTWFPNENPRVFVDPCAVLLSNAYDYQYEGCLSFFDVRGRVTARLISYITVCHT